MNTDNGLTEDELGQACLNVRRAINDAFAEARRRVARWEPRPVPPKEEYP